jgi:membrane protein YqaA with SNARE-associated domain
MRRTSKSPLPRKEPGASELKEKLAEERQRIVLHKRPLTTVRLFSQAAAEFASDSISYLSRHPVTLHAIPAVALVYFALRLLGMAQGVEHVVVFTTWWLGLGVLSSIGLGTGLHTGMLFLFPHIFKVVQAAELCKSMDFSSTQDIWYAKDVVMCSSPAHAAGSSHPSFFAVALRCWIPAVIWGAGTAIGEVPPYLMSRAAMLAGGALEDEVKEELKIDSSNPLGLMKQWMIKFVERYGFWGVFLMSAWPNAAFDLVGIVCGQIGVTFWTFFLATFCGKALVKVTGQVIFFVSIFRHTSDMIALVVWLIEKLPSVVVARLPNEAQIQIKLEKLIEQLSTGKAAQQPESEAGWLKWGFDTLIMLIIASFAISCVNQFAQKRQKDIDNVAIKKSEKSSKSKNKENGGKSPRSAVAKSASPPSSSRKKSSDK